MVGGRTGELISYRGAVIVHPSREEMQFVFPMMRVVRVSDGDLGQPTMQLRDHPDLAHFRWPLRREDFR